MIAAFMRMASLAILGLFIVMTTVQTSHSRWVYQNKQVCSQQRKCTNQSGVQRRCKAQRVCRTSYKTLRRCSPQRSCSTRYTSRRSCRPYRRCTTYRSGNRTYRRCSTYQRCTTQRVPQRRCTTRNRCTTSRQPYRQCRTVNRCNTVKSPNRACTTRRVCRVQRVRVWVADGKPNNKSRIAPNRRRPTTPVNARRFAPRSQIIGCTRYRSVAKKYCSTPGGYHAVVTNRCNVKILATVCYRRANRTWSCYSSRVGAGQSRTIGFACNAGRYYVFPKDVRDPKPTGRCPKSGCS